LQSLKNCLQNLLPVPRLTRLPNTALINGPQATSLRLQSAQLGATEAKEDKEAGVSAANFADPNVSRARWTHGTLTGQLAAPPIYFSACETAIFSRD
jgi:hypothetical protein